MSLQRIFNRIHMADALDRPGLGGETYLTRAVKIGDVKMVQEFLDIGADPDVSNEAGELPLHIALVAQNFRVMHALLETGANVFLKQQDMTLSQHADKLGMPKISAILRELEERKIAATIAATMAMPTGGMGVLPLVPSREDVKKRAERENQKRKKTNQPKPPNR